MNFECPVTTSRSCIVAPISIEIRLVFDHIRELNSDPACDGSACMSLAPPVALRSADCTTADGRAMGVADAGVEAIEAARSQPLQYLVGQRLSC